jgi:hypothetical protein
MTMPGPFVRCGLRLLLLLLLLLLLRTPFKLAVVAADPLHLASRQEQLPL